MIVGQISGNIVSIFTGGVAGAILTSVFGYYRTRVQPIGYKINVQSIAPRAENWTIDTSITVKIRPNESYIVDRLFLVEIDISNRSNKDFDHFDFGITLPEGVTILDIKSNVADRHHILQQMPSPVESRTAFLEEGIDILEELEAIGRDLAQVQDFRLHPFNRKDKYLLRLVIAPIVLIHGTDQYKTTDTIVSVGDIKISTPQTGVRFEGLTKPSYERLRVIKPILIAMVVVFLAGLMQQLLAYMAGHSFDSVQYAISGIAVIAMVAGYGITPALFTKSRGE